MGKRSFRKKALDSATNRTYIKREPQLLLGTGTGAGTALWIGVPRARLPTRLTKNFSAPYQMLPDTEPIFHCLVSPFKSKESSISSRAKSILLIRNPR